MVASEVSTQIDLQSLLRAAETPRSEHSVRLLSLIGPRELSYILEGVLNCEARRSCLVQRPYLHILGFEKLILAQSSDESCVRLHIWSNDEPALSTDDVHNHMWNFSSKIIYGKLAVTTYETSKSTEDSAYSYEYNSSLLQNGNHHLTFTGRSYVRVISNATMLAGQTYGLQSNEFHTTCNLEDTVTLVLQGPRVSNETRVIKRNFLGQTLDFPPLKRYSAEVGRSKLGELASRLASRQIYGIASGSAHPSSI